MGDLLISKSEVMGILAAMYATHTDENERKLLNDIKIAISWLQEEEQK